jgi:two-component system NarL family sensor kinase
MLRLRDDHGARGERSGLAARPPRLGSAVGRFMLGSLLAIAVVVVGGFFALHSVAVDEAERDTKERVRTLGRLVETSGLDDRLLQGDRAAQARLDRLVRSEVRQGSVVRVKLWTKPGQILYSDEPRLIGRTYQMGDEEQDLFETGGADSELSDLSQPENRFERSEGKLLEAHTVIETPNGTPVLFEIYERFSSINENGERLLGKMAPPLLAAVLVLVLFQVPLAWSMARRLQRGHRERERLLASAVEASTQERRRIAADLHDGVVQDLAGVAFGLAPLAADAEKRSDGGEAAVLHGSIAQLRQGVRDLRTLLVEIHPQSLESAGLEAALNDLLSPLAAEGIDTELHVEHPHGKDPNDPLLYRVAREALRNVQAHSQAGSVRIDVTRSSNGTSGTRLTVIDDGRGFDAGERERRAGEGHVGLSLLEGLVAQSDGRLSVRSEPGAGTTVELEVPDR